MAYNRKKEVIRTPKIVFSFKSFKKWNLGRGLFFQVDGHVFVAYNPGSQDNAIGEMNAKVNDGRYHVVRFTRSAANSTLQIDDNQIQTKFPDGGCTPFLSSFPGNTKCFRKPFFAIPTKLVRLIVWHNWCMRGGGGLLWSLKQGLGATVVDSWFLKLWG